jgi:diketogulonate reductase-like aldo/keto reductase
MHSAWASLRPSLTARSLKNPDVTAMAEKYRAGVPQLCIRYPLQLDAVSLPKMANPENMRTNAEVDFVVTDEDVAALKNLHAQDCGASSAFPVYSGK